jgi:5-methylcytosine-specific restriction enzyme A
VMSLSDLLRSLPYHGPTSRMESFRNPDGVAFKLQNLHQVATGRGLENYSEMDRKIWQEFGSRAEVVTQLAALIRFGIETSVTVGIPDDIMDNEEFFEGRVLTRIHKWKERNLRVRKSLLALRRKAGQLTCDMCSAPSRATSPTLEDASFEAHHLLPLSRAIERNTRITDLALLCANCHRILHRAITINSRWITIEEGKQLVTR